MPHQSPSQSEAEECLANAPLVGIITYGHRGIDLVRSSQLDDAGREMNASRRRYAIRERQRGTRSCMYNGDWLLRRDANALGGKIQVTSEVSGIRQSEDLPPTIGN